MDFLRRQEVQFAANVSLHRTHSAGRAVGQSRRRHDQLRAGSGDAGVPQQLQQASAGAELVRAKVFVCSRGPLNFTDCTKQYIKRLVECS